MGDRAQTKSAKSKTGTNDGRPLLRAIAAGLSDVGLQREHNEDSFIVLSDYDLFVVADGMGGHRAGDVASKLATETISEFFRSTASDDVTWPFHFDTNLSDDENRLLTGIRVANRQIYERSTRSREYHGMGTTVVGAMFSPRRRRMYIGHVGDSRCYRVRDGKIAQLTRDHSLINDYLLAMPDLTEEQRAELPKNVITRALGMQDQVVVDLQHDEPIPGDTYILCSDGLSGMVTDEEIEAIVTDQRDIREACKKLIARANEQGGEDNVTAVLVRIELEAASAGPTGPAGGVGGAGSDDKSSEARLALGKTEEMARATLPDAAHFADVAAFVPPMAPMPGPGTPAVVVSSGDDDVGPDSETHEHKIVVNPDAETAPAPEVTISDKALAFEPPTTPTIKRPASE